MKIGIDQDVQNRVILSVERNGVTYEVEVVFDPPDDGGIYVTISKGNTVCVEQGMDWDEQEPIGEDTDGRSDYDEHNTMCKAITGCT